MSWKKDEKIIEKYTPVRAFITFIIVALLAFIIIHSIRTYEGDLFGPKKDFSGTDQELTEKARDNQDTEYCEYIQDESLKSNCLTIADTDVREPDQDTLITQEAYRTNNIALCDQIIDEYRKSNCKTIVGG